MWISRPVGAVSGVPAYPRGPYSSRARLLSAVEDRTCCRQDIIQLCYGGVHKQTCKISNTVFCVMFMRECDVHMDFLARLARFRCSRVSQGSVLFTGSVAGRRKGRYMVPPRYNVPPCCNNSEAINCIHKITFRKTEIVEFAQK